MGDSCSVLQSVVRIVAAGPAGVVGRRAACGLRAGAAAGGAGYATARSGRRNSLDPASRPPDHRR
jgi:hypothetical protein